MSNDSASTDITNDDGFQAFISDALRTESRPESLKINPVVFLAYLQLASVTAAMGDMLKKGAFYGREVNVEAFCDEAMGVVKLGQILASVSDDVNDLTAKPMQINNRKDDGTVEELELTPTSFNMRVAHGLLGNFTEAGELIEAMVTSVTEGKPLDRVNIGEEFADQDWYKAIVFNELELKEVDTRRGVIAKLRARYPDKFTDELAHDRDLAAERAALESNIA